MASRWDSETDRYGPDSGQVRLVGVEAGWGRGSWVVVAVQVRSLWVI